MASKSLDGRYRINIEPGLRVMIKADEAIDLIPCYVKEILTQDPMHDLGIKVTCEDGKTGRIKHIGTETTCMEPADLISNLEKKLRSLIATELSADDPKWWENKIQPKIRERISISRQTGARAKKVLQIPNYDLIDELYFSEISDIILAKKNWKLNFEKIFHDRDALRVKLHELAPCRNISAHSKVLTVHLRRKIQVYYDDIIPLVEAYERNQFSDNPVN